MGQPAAAGGGEARIRDDPVGERHDPPQTEGVDVTRRGVLLGTGLLAAGAAVGGGATQLSHAVRSDSYIAPPLGWQRPTSATVVWSCDSDRRLVALTFDDGPDRRWTPLVLETLGRHGMKATFFVVGEAATRYPDLVRRASAAGHEIGNHTWSHDDLLSCDIEDARPGISRTQEVVADLVGAPPRVFRPPWGRLNPSCLYLVNSLGMTTVMWSHHVSAGGYRLHTDQLLQRLEPGGIVLMHDGGSTPTEGLMTGIDQCVERLAADGWTGVTMSELLESTT